MSLPNRVISDVDEMKKFVEQFVSLLDAEMSKWEEKIKDPTNIADLIHAMPALISLVNTVGYLRGQDGMFDVGPEIRVALSADIRKYEDIFEERLNKLIDVLLQSKEKGYYEQRLDSYFTKSRTKQKPTVAW